MGSFKTIGILGRIDSPQALVTLKHLKVFLEAVKVNVLVEQTSAQAMHGVDSITLSGNQICTQKVLCEQADLIIVVGGDGTLLSAGRVAAQYGKPLLGVNRGRLGFLTDVNPSDLEQSISGVLAGEYKVERRFLLEVETNADFKGLALNDVVLNSGRTVSMVEFELYVDKQFVYSQSSDGLIISTPTGSTAYAMSGGGPIMHPSLDAIVLVPMFPHTLSSRPIVIDGNSEISIVPSSTSVAPPRITCDGHENVLLDRGSEVIIKKSQHVLELLHPLNHDFYQACRSKLGWGAKF